MFPSTIHLRGYPLPVAYSWHPCQRSVDHICVGLFLISLFCSIVLCLSLCQYHTVLITIALIHFEIQKYDASNFVLFSDHFSYSSSIRILGFFFYFFKKCHWDFDGDSTESIDCFG